MASQHGRKPPNPRYVPKQHGHKPPPPGAHSNSGKGACSMTVVLVPGVVLWLLMKALFRKVVRRG